MIVFFQLHRIEYLTFNLANGFIILCKSSLNLARSRDPTGMMISVDPAYSGNFPWYAVLEGERFSVTHHKMIH